MANVQGQILSLHGTVKAIDASGKIRILKAGDILLPGERLQLEEGADIRFTRGDGQIVELDGNRQMQLSEDLLRPHNAEANESQVAALTEEAKKILASLDAPADANQPNPFDNLEPAAAGLNDAGPGNDGSTFVRVARIAESINPLQLNSSQNAAVELHDARGNAADARLPLSEQAIQATNVIGGNGDGSAIEQTQPSTSGALTASNSNNPALGFVSGNLRGEYGSLTVDATGKWTYTLDNRADALTQGQKVDDKITVTLNDGTTTTVTIHVTGTNNPAELSTGAGQVKEDTADQSQASGTLTITDKDAGEAVFVASSQTNDYGTFKIGADGKWTFDINNASDKVQALAEGEKHVETFTVASKDGTTSTVTITIVGTNDTPVFSGKDSGDVYENATDAKAVLGFDGQIVATDADHDQSGFKTTVTPAQGTLGTLTIQADGNWHYSVDNSKVQYLRSGETRDEHFTVTSLDGTTHDIVVTIHGTDNAPVFSGKDSGDVYENATDAKAVLGFDGQIVATDADHDQSGFKTTVTPAQGTLGTLTIQADGNWHYSVDNSKVQYLRSGETRDEHFTVTSLDGTTHDIVVTIHGTDNAPVFSGKDSGDVYENATDAKAVLGFDGQIVATDADHDQSGFKTTVTPAQGTLGTLTIQADGNWHYSVDNSKVQYLRSGETRDEHFTVTSLDGTTHDIVVTIHGTDNAPVFSGKDSGDVYENATDAKAVLGFDGQIVATDADHDQSGFKTTVTPAQNTLGTLTIQADGNWHYSVDNSKVQYLRSGETRDEHFTVTSLDGTTHDIVVTIHGTDNAPVFSGKDSGDVYENATDAKAVLGFDGQIVATDADHDQSGFKTTVTPAQNTLGTLTIQADGNWHYSVDNSKVQYLRSGETRDEHFTVTSLDGTTHDIVVTIHGTDNVPVFSGKDSGDVYENATDAKAVLGFDGQIVATDADHDQSGFKTTVTPAQGTLGTLTIQADGNWHYSVDNSKVQYLRSGETRDEHFTVTSLDGTTHDIVVTIHGTDNAPVFSGKDSGDVYENATDAKAVLGFDGQIVATDADHDQSGFKTTVTPAQGTLGTLTIQADGNWHYSVDNSKVQYLRSGETRDEHFTVTSLDGTTHDIVVTIHGTDNVPVFSGKDSGDVYENATDAKAVLGFDGQIVATDADHDQSGFKTTVTPAQGTLGTLTIQADGNWHYSVDNSKVQYLRSGETRDEHFTVTSLDGTTHDIVVTIHGTDNVPVFSGKDSGDVYENATDAKAVLGFDGQIVATDADHDQSGFKTTVTPAQGTLGTLTIQADGNWHYSVDNSKVQYLRSGETRDEHFTVTSLDGTTHDIVVTIHGTDNAPVFSGKDSGDVYENATDAKAVLGFDGQIVATDADHDQSGFKTTVTPAQGTLGTLTIQADGNWHYSVDNSKVQYLRSGETRDEHFTVTSLDGTTHDIVVTIHGTDNVPVFSGKDSGDVYENATDAKAVLGFDGQIVATDADHDQSGFKTTVTPAQGTLGTLTIQADGNWHYSVDNSKVQYLRSGETRDEHFTVTSLDGTTHDIVVTIHGTDNAPVFSGKDSGDVYENATDAKAVLGFDGQIVATDADHDQSGFKTIVTPAQGTLGTLTIQADGNWHYSVDNSKVQYLRSGETRDEHFTVTSLDGTTHDIVVTIHGTDNAPVFSGKDSGDVYENATDAKAVLGFDGQIVATDADHDQSGFKTTVTPAQNTLGTLTIQADGNWHYSVDNSKVQYLRSGETRDEHFTVTSLDGTTHDIVVTIHGTDNVPVFSGKDSGDVYENATDAKAVLGFDGQIVATDADHDQSGFKTTVTPAQGTLGTLTIQADGNWHYSVDNSKVQYLRSGETRDEHFTVTSLDGTTHDIVVTIHGTDNVPVFSGKDSGDVYENATDAKAVLGFDGQIVATDADHDQSGFKTTVTPAQNTLGTLTIQADGNWHYSVDNSKVQYLRSGETRDEHFTVTSLDGTTHDIVVTIHGTDNVPVFSGKDSGDVYENATDAKAVLGFDGQIVATDADHDQSGFKTTVTPAQGTLGTLTIQADGNWHYSVDNSKVQYLRSGETRDEHFTVTSLDGTTHDIVVTIHGTDNAPVFSGKDSGDVYENATDAKAVLGFDGQIVATDADHDQSGFKTTVTPAQGTLGTLTIQADGNWHYSVDNSKVQYLRSGETRDEHFTVTSLDGTTHDIVVTIHGTDNVPVFSGKDSGDVYENATDAKAVLGFDGQIVATDADHDQSGFKTTVTPAQGTLGTLTIQADGNWHYSVDNSKVQYLRSGETRDEHFTVTSLDGTTHDIVVTIHGTDNAPVFSGKDSGDVYENATDAKAVLGFDGQIVATDADHDQSGFKTTVTPAQGTLGTLTIQADGNWHYSVDNSKVQYLRSGETRDEHFTVTSLDGTTHDIVVTIHGTDNAPVFSGKDSGDVYENATDAKAVLGFDGQIVATDADHDQSGFKTTVTPAQGTLGTLTIQADGNWHYSVDNSKVQYLRSGETRDEHFTVTSLDGTTHDIVVTIHGTDNAPVFSGKDSGDVYENATDAKAVLGFDGQIVATDADHDQSGFKTTVTPAQNTLGTLTIQADGNWHYSVDNSKVQYLRSGETRDEHFTVTSLDGTTHDIVVTIHGTDNAPVFSGKDSGDVYENATDAKAVLGFDGQIVATDADHDQSGFKTTVTPAQGTLGTLTIQADGNWHYSVDNSKVQYLRSGETRDEHFTVTSLDGTTHDIVVTIHGTDNARSSPARTAATSMRTPPTPRPCSASTARSSPPTPTMTRAVSRPPSPRPRARSAP
ncbi:retention module-containing protein [Chromobacterium sp. IIBBL 290-4]|uniref:retention module-containing protein n=1 Tax=Chromobacterium sp. IIBBL 290-4 TaxID=2953890 RepID=UPI0020B86A8C|nr:retention module-containing protein [Chromobacterium sp. IIBBL 290-4]UTH75987.1 retention module-containing protein [Chromobacterium sp. IIBBL 290-4]